MNDLYFIAEIGSNWYADSEYDQRSNIDSLFKSAKQAGADAIKFQVFRADGLYSKERAFDLWARTVPYEFPLDYVINFRAISMANNVKIDVWASAFDLDMLYQISMHVDAIKIASGDFTYWKLIEKAADYSRFHKIPLVLSTGAATQDEIIEMLKWMDAIRPYSLILFHCVSSYPAEPTAMNLRGGLLFKDYVDAIGLSDHTVGTHVAQLAAAMGYTYFEKHFTGDVIGDTPDSVVSLSTEDMHAYINDANYANSIAGIPKKIVHPSEMSERRMARRWIDGLRPNTGEKI